MRVHYKCYSRTLWPNLDTVRLTYYTLFLVAVLRNSYLITAEPYCFTVLCNYLA